MAHEDDAAIVQNLVKYQFGDLPDDGVALLLAYATSPEKLARHEMESFVIGMNSGKGDRAWECAGSTRFRRTRPREETADVELSLGGRDECDRRRRLVRPGRLSIKAAPAFRYPERCQPNQERQIMSDRSETPGAEESARLEFVAGQVHALLAFALAVIETHPSPAVIEQHLGLAQQAGLARTESTLLSDDFLDGQRDVMDRLQQRALRARERREGRNTRGPQET